MLLQLKQWGGEKKPTPTLARYNTWLIRRGVVEGWVFSWEEDKSAGLLEDQSLVCQ